MAKQKMIQVVHLPVNGKPEVISVENKLETFQRLVGGYIQPVYLDYNNYILLVNDEGLLMELARNPHVQAYEIVGDAVLLREAKEHFASIDTEDVHKVLNNL